MAVPKALRKLGLLDYLILFVIILSVLIFSKFIHHKTTWINIDTIAYSSVFQASSLHVGDIETEPSGKKIAEIKSIDIQDSPLTNNTNTLFSKIVILHLKILTDYTNDGNIQYKNQPLRVGSQVDFTFNSASMQTYISSINDSYEYTYKTITLVLYNRWPWLADGVNIGDTKKDLNGFTIIKVIGKNTTPAEVLNTDSNGQSITSYDNSKTDITLKLRVRAQKVNGELVFQGYNNLTIGNQVSLDIGKTSLVNGYITNIE
ncbi:MAG TPA: DUF4330 family protein [Patescibacteria group bacterium]|nr:DUF4330 family protein [Patescibacteria group bacterium]